MTTTTPTPPPALEPETTTPTLRAVAKRIRFWVILGLAVVLVAVIALIAGQRSTSSTERLDPANPGPNGTEALVQVLQEHGVEVTATDTLDETEGAIRSRNDVTVLLYDPNDILSSQQHDRLSAEAGDIVAVEPDLIALSELAPGIGVAGAVTDDDALSAGCDLAAARKAGTIRAAGIAYRALADADNVSCFRAESGHAVVRQRIDGDSTVTALGLGDTLTNGHITDAGNAALALNLLGSHRTLVWYIPGFGDLPQDSSLSLADYQPDWVVPLIALLGLAAVAAMFWRGRRLGPVVVENLPVVVRARETMEGRARLYERSNARLHALDALRIGAIDRLARRCKLPWQATVDEVVDAVAAATGNDRGEVAGILRDTEPGTDAELIRLSDELRRLETETSTATRP